MVNIILPSVLNNNLNLTNPLHLADRRILAWLEVREALPRFSRITWTCTAPQENRSAQLSKPWITKGIRTFIKTMNELYFSGERDKYKFYRNKTLYLSRLSIKTFYHNYFKQNMRNMKKTWEGINAFISHNKNKAIFHIKRPDNNTMGKQLKIPISLIKI